MEGERGPILPASARGWWIAGGIAAVALIGRLGLVLAISPRYHPQTDALSFDQLAASLAQGHGFGVATLPPMIGPTAFRAPLYPLFLAAVYGLFGVHSFAAALYANAVLGAITAVLVGVIATQLLGQRIGAVAMAIAAIEPAMYVTGSSLQLEPLLTTLCLGGLAAALQHRRSPRGVLWPLIAGVCIGLGVLTREQAALFLPVIVWLIWSADRPLPRVGRADRSVGLRSSILVVVAAVLVVLPWTTRNATELHAFVPVSTASGFGLAGTYNDTAMHERARWIPPYNDPTMARVLVDLSNPTEVRVDSAMRSASLDVVRAHPVYPLQVAFWNTIRGFDLDGGSYTHLIRPYLPYPPVLLGPAIWIGWLLLALAVAGATTTAVRAVPRSIWVIPLSVIGFTAFFLPFSIRYRSLIEPFTVVLVACAVVAIYDGWRAVGRIDAPPTAPVGRPARRQLVAAPRAGERVRPSRPR